MPYHKDVRKEADLGVSWSELYTTGEQRYVDRDQRHHGHIGAFLKEGQGGR